jgi:hypothetical protein
MRNNETIYEKNIPKCYNETNKIFRNYYKDFNEFYNNLCQKKYEQCTSSCNNSINKLECIKEKECKINYNCENVINDINILIDIINKIDKNDKSINLNHIKQIGIIISKNLTNDDKKEIKNKYSKNLNCNDTQNPCTINSKLLLHYILFIIIKRISIIYNINKEQFEENKLKLEQDITFIESQIEQIKIILNDDKIEDVNKNEIKNKLKLKEKELKLKENKLNELVLSNKDTLKKKENLDKILKNCDESIGIPINDELYIMPT